MRVNRKIIKRSPHLIWAAFLLALLPRMIFLGITYPMSIAGDESFLFLPAAEWAGYDWSGLSGMYRYYGYGFVVFLTPLFKWIQDPVLLYRIMVFLMILLQAAVAPVVYHLLRRFFGMQDGAAILLISTLVSYLVFLRAVYVYNEFVYDTGFWLSLWVLLSLQDAGENKKKRIGLTVLLLGVLTYEMTVHSRAVTLFLALGVTFFFYLWTYRKSILSVPAGLLLGGAGLLLAEKGIDYIVDLATTASSSSEIGNTSVAFSMGNILGNTKSWTAWLYIVAGQVNTMVLVTGGIALFAAALGCWLLWKALLRREDGFLEENRRYVLVCMYCLSAAAITILGQSLSWLTGVTNAIFEGGNPDSLRAITYLRYYGVYFAPVVMVFLAWFVQKRDCRQFLVPACVAGGILQVFWFCCIIPVFGEFNGTSWEFNPFSFTKGWEDPIRIRTYLAAMVFFALFLAVGCYAVKRQRELLLLTLLTALFFYQYAFNCVYHEGARGKITYASCEKTYEALMRVREELPEDIYVEHTWVPESAQSLVCEYQFLLKDRHIVPGLPEEQTEGVYLCMDKETGSELEQSGYLCAALSEQAYIFSKDKEVIEALEKTGVVWK